MNTTPPDSPVETATAAPADDGPRVTRDEVRDLGRLRRSREDRKVAGVAGGLARHLDIDPILLRVGFVVLAFFGGAGLILYAAGWLLVPEEGDERARVHLDERSRTIALVALGVVAALALVGDSWGAYWFPWPLAIIGLIAFVWLSRQRTDNAPRSDSGPGVPPAPAYVGSRPRDPRKRGPILFWFTLLLIAVAEGVLSIIDGAGAPIADSAYAALALGVIATMLIVGSVIGRAGGLIALGLLGSLILAAATVGDRWDGEPIAYRPTSAQQVVDTYGMDSGELLLDLSGVEDVEGLDGRTIELDGNIGEIEVVLPDGVDAQVTSDIDGPGGYELFERSGGGFGSRVTESYDGGQDVPTVVILASLRAGEITIRTEGMS